MRTAPAVPLLDNDNSVTITHGIGQTSGGRGIRNGNIEPLAQRAALNEKAGNLRFTRGFQFNHRLIAVFSRY
jgi:hypothetical protein